MFFSAAKKKIEGNENMFFDAHLDKNDPELYKTLQGELKRQQNQIELIASENIVSQAVLEAQGSVLTNKYAEGKQYVGDTGRKVTDDFNAFVEKSKDAVQRQKEQLSAAFEAGKAAYREEKGISE